MIIPFWLKWNYFLRAPVTLALLALNIFISLALPSKYGVELPRILNQKIQDRDFLIVQSYLYENNLKRKSPEQWGYWTGQLHKGDGAIRAHQIDEFWFKLSFRDGDFLSRAFDAPAYPDVVKYTKWKKVFQELRDYQENDFSGLFGVSIYGSKWSHFITYQFVHAGFLHLFSNMMILVLFGMLIEIQMGSIKVLTTYLIGGALGGLFYAQTSGLNLAPLIGASGSVSALIAYLLVMEPRTHLRFFYFILPVENYFGDIYLSKWWLIPLLILGDLNAVLTSPDWTLSVAHTAHLGAIIFGLATGIADRWILRPVSLKESLTWTQTT